MLFYRFGSRKVSFREPAGRFILVLIMRFEHAPAHRLHRLSDPEVLAAGGQARSCSSLHFSIFGNLSLVRKKHGAQRGTTTPD
jgi:hypothetical protein